MSEGSIIGYVNFPNQPGYCDVSPATNSNSGLIQLSCSNNSCSNTVQPNTPSQYKSVFPGWDLNSTSNISVTEDSSKNTIVSGSLYVDLAYITTSTTAPYFTLSCPTNAISSPGSSSDTPSITIEVFIVIPIANGSYGSYSINNGSYNITNGSYLNSFNISFTTSSNITSTGQTALNSATLFSISVQITNYDIYYTTTSCIPFCNGFGYNYTAPSTSTATNLISVNYNTSPTTPITIGIANYTNTNNLTNQSQNISVSWATTFNPGPILTPYTYNPAFILQNAPTTTSSSSNSSPSYYSQVVLYNICEYDVAGITLPTLASGNEYFVSNVTTYAVMMSNNGLNWFNDNSENIPNINGFNWSQFEVQNYDPKTTTGDLIFNTGWPITGTIYTQITTPPLTYTVDTSSSTQPNIYGASINISNGSYYYYVGQTIGVNLTNYNAGYCSGLGVVIDNIPLTCTSTNTSTDTTFTYTLNPLKPQLIAYMNKSINNALPFSYTQPGVITTNQKWTLGNQVDFIMSQGGNEYYNTSATYKLMKFFNITLSIIPTTTSYQ